MKNTHGLKYFILPIKFIHELVNILSLGISKSAREIMNTNQLSPKVQTTIACASDRQENDSSKNPALRGVSKELLDKVNNVNGVWDF